MDDDMFGGDEADAEKIIAENEVRKRENELIHVLLQNYNLPKAGFMDGLDTPNAAEIPQIKLKYRQGFTKGMNDSVKSGTALGQSELLRILLALKGEEPTNLQRTKEHILKVGELPEEDKKKLATLIP